MKVRFAHAHRDFVGSARHGQNLWSIIAHHPETKEIYGHLNYTTSAHKNDSRAYVDMVHVEPEHQKKGIGRRLLRELYKRFHPRDVRHGLQTQAGSRMLQGYARRYPDEIHKQYPERAMRFLVIPNLSEAVDPEDRSLRLKKLHDYANRHMELAHRSARSYRSTGDHEHVVLANLHYLKAIRARGMANLHKDKSLRSNYKAKGGSNFLQGIRHALKSVRSGSTKIVGGLPSALGPGYTPPTISHEDD